jgi:hypothetical protein
MDLIYTNSEMVDQGILREYELDLAFGADENNLECRIQAGSHCCEAGSILYVDGTEYGGIIDSIESKTDTKEIFYRGRTWHGILNSKVLQPDGGQAYLTLSGEANSVLGTLIDRMALTGLFEASSEDSGLTIKNYKMNRYITGYDGILKMLKSAGGKLLLTFRGGKVILSAAKVRDYSQDEEFDADLVPFHAKRNYKGVNHLICLGSGQLEERTVIHLYADTEGNISQEQTQFGLDEVSAIYENTNIETEEELTAEGIDRLKELTASDEISIDFDADSDAYDIGDIIGAVDNITGLMAYTTIAKKIVTIKNGQITVSLSPDTAKAGSSMEVGGGAGGGGGGVESFNGRTGAVVPTAGDYTAEQVGAASSDLSNVSNEDMKAKIEASGFAGGVESFNGRQGAVLPQSGDYTAEQVGAAPAENGFNYLTTVNKPTGSYTGNGSATARTIETGGIGKMVVVWCPYLGLQALVGPYGCIVTNYNGATLANIAGASFWQGVGLQLATSHNALNASGVTYEYQVL